MIQSLTQEQAIEQQINFLMQRIDALTQQDEDLMPNDAIAPLCHIKAREFSEIIATLIVRSGKSRAEVLKVCLNNQDFVKKFIFISRLIDRLVKDLS